MALAILWLLSGLALCQGNLRPSSAFKGFEGLLMQGRVTQEMRAEDWTLNYTAWRQIYPATWNQIIPNLPGSTSTPVTMEVGGSKVSGQWVAAPGLKVNPRQGMVLYFHGGAYLVGNLLMYEHALQHISRDLSLPVLFVDYRLAPEHPLPAAVEDCLVAYKWVLSSLSVSPGKLVVMGDSAGGGLVALVLQNLKKERAPFPAAGVLLSPWLDLSYSGETYPVNKDVDAMISDLLLSPHLVRAAIRGIPASHASVSPLFGDWEGLPPLFFLVGQNEILLSDSLRGAKKAREVGVTTHLEIAPHMSHDFPLFGDVFPEARDGRLQIAAFVTQHINGEFVGLCATNQRDVKVAIIGGGFSGLLTAIEMRALGVSFTIFEQAADLGGTWFINKYPGLACDVSSILYEYAFSPKLNWTHSNPPASEICEYLRQVAIENNVLSALRLEHEVTRVEWQEASKRWKVTVDHRGVKSEEMFDAVVSAVGQLTVPKMPTYPGAQTFKGLASHSKNFDRSTSVAGKRVGVVGTGPSASQIIQTIASEVGSLDIFQRSAPYIVPFPQGPMESMDLATKKAMRAQAFEAFEGLHLAMTPNSMVGQMMKAQFLAAARANFPNDSDVPKVIPDYPYACKRLVISGTRPGDSTIYWEVLKQPNVQVIVSDIEKVVPEGIQTKDGKLHPLDILIWAIGYESTKFLNTFEVIGEGGKSLQKEEWKRYPRAYYGITVPNFPNFFMLYGPNTNLGHNSVIPMFEAEASYIRQLVDQLRCGVRKVTVRRDAFEVHNKQLQDQIREMVWAQECNNWYKTADGTQTNNWPDTVRSYQRQLKIPRWADYQLE